jgi:hypothetical protein
MSMRREDRFRVEYMDEGDWFESHLTYSHRDDAHAKVDVLSESERVQAAYVVDTACRCRIIDELELVNSGVLAAVRSGDREELLKAQLRRDEVEHSLFVIDHGREIADELIPEMSGYRATAPEDAPEGMAWVPSPEGGGWVLEPLKMSAVVGIRTSSEIADYVQEGYRTGRYDNM